MMSLKLRGRLLALVGVLVLTPDSLLVRLTNIDAWTMSFWRGAILGLVLTVVGALVYGRRFVSAITGIGWLGLGVAALFTGSTLCFVAALSHTSVASTLVIIAGSPIVTAVLSQVFLKEPAPLRTWIAMLVGLAGIVIVVYDDSQSHHLLGDLAAFGTMLCVSLAFTLVRAAKDVDLAPAMGITGWLTALVAFPLASPMIVSAEGAVYLAILGVIVLPVSFVALTVAPRYLPAAEVNLFMLLETVLGPVWVWIVLAERPSAWALSGGVIVVVALLAHAAAGAISERALPDAA